MKHAFAFLLVAFSALSPARAETETPLAELPYSPSLSVAAMDRSIDPCFDFYAYSCAGWEKSNPIPSDQGNWSVYAKVTQDNQRFLWGLLETAAKDAPGRTATERLIGDYFQACMDVAGIEKAGLAPVRADLDAVAALSAKDQIAPLLGKLHPTGFANRMLFGFGSTQDADDASRVMPEASAGGLGLPDRSYYLENDERTQSIRDAYTAHVARIFGLAGDAPEVAAAKAKSVISFETALAEAALSRVERRDPYKTWHRTQLADLQKLTPTFSWGSYLDGVGSPKVADLNVTEPKFFERVERQLKDVSLADWQTYLSWQILNVRANILTDAFRTANFELYSKTLRGVQTMPPRWKTCVNGVDRDLGEALGQVFVAKSFSPETKASTLDMTLRIEKAMAARIAALPWMGEETKKQALAKLSGMRNKIGYPDVWRDFSGLAIERADYVGNVARSRAFESRRDLAKVGKPVDRGEWSMTPPTVNAYYDAQLNDMNFPAGVLLPPLYDAKSDDAPNYGDTGGTIGHELTHGFDDEGRQYDANGNLRDWWTAADGKEFEKRAKCVADQYAQYPIVDDLKINSQLTLGEDVADLGGEIIAYAAWKDATKDKKLMPVEGLTPNQRFFVGFAQWVCNNDRPENLRLRAKTDPHSPGRFRINGVVVNMPEFAQAFACKPGQPMVKKPEDVCRIW
ncbi:MAG TPA: M13 family metallopeptidase [Thermoanaerobaculia bacterium]|jgi:endothelin-converting enzyme/putative endopeptidase|nr:M13 family metallopeptidase [Thermoanaerobaculia bacterium]